MAEADIEDHFGNQTSFVLIARPGHPPVFEGTRHKTSLALFLQADKAGALLMILSEFAYAGINLTKIQSRPTKQALGEYMFFVDLEGSTNDVAVQTALNCLRLKLREVKVLGSYPVDVSPGAGRPCGSERDRAEVFQQDLGADEDEHDAAGERGRALVARAEAVAHRPRPRTSSTNVVVPMSAAESPMSTRKNANVMPTAKRVDGRGHGKHHQLAQVQLGRRPVRRRGRIPRTLRHEGRPTASSRR